MTQMQAAESIGIEYTTLGKIERGLVPYGQELLESAAVAYRCSPADLISVDPESTPPTPEGRLRAAFLAYGVDADDLPAVFRAISGFVDDRAEQPRSDQHHDQLEPASPRRESAPSTSRSRQRAS